MERHTMESLVAITATLAMATVLSLLIFNIRWSIDNTEEAERKCIRAGGSATACCMEFREKDEDECRPPTTKRNLRMEKGD